MEVKTITIKYFSMFSGIGGFRMIEKLYGNIPSYGKSYFTEKFDETGSSVVKNLFKRIILSKRGGING